MKVEKISDIINIIPYKENYITEGSRKESSVLIPLVEKEDKLYILFEKRSQWVSQPGEICFPGGRVDESDQDSERTALRETMEELGYDEKDVNMLGKLGVVLSHHLSALHCHIGFIHWKDVEEKRYNKSEVEEILLVDLDELLRTEADNYTINVRTEVNIEDEDGNINHYFPAKELGLPEIYHEGWNMGTRTIVSYNLGNVKIWGLTGFILKYFLSKVDEII